MLKVSSKSAALLQRQSPALTRALATVADPPVRRYGGLKDQDRIFTNAYCRHDHGLKGALVSLYALLRCVLKSKLIRPVPRRLAPDKRHHAKRRLLDHPNHQRLWT